MFCENCGSQTKEEFKFCKGCGAKVKSNVEIAPELNNLQAVTPMQVPPVQEIPVQMYETPAADRMEYVNVNTGVPNQFDMNPTNMGQMNSNPVVGQTQQMLYPNTPVNNKRKKKKFAIGALLVLVVGAGFAYYTITSSAQYIVGKGIQKTINKAFNEVENAAETIPAYAHFSDILNSDYDMTFSYSEYDFNFEYAIKSMLSSNELEVSAFVNKNELLTCKTNGEIITVEGALFNDTYGVNASELSQNNSNTSLDFKSHTKIVSQIESIITDEITEIIMDNEPKVNKIMMTIDGKEVAVDNYVYTLEYSDLYEAYIDVIENSLEIKELDEIMDIMESNDMSIRKEIKEYIGLLESFKQYLKGEFIEIELGIYNGYLVRIESQGVQVQIDSIKNIGNSIVFSFDNEEALEINLQSTDNTVNFAMKDLYWEENIMDITYNNNRFTIAADGDELKIDMETPSKNEIDIKLTYETYWDEVTMSLSSKKGNISNYKFSIDKNYQDLSKDIRNYGVEALYDVIDYSFLYNLY